MSGSRSGAAGGSVRTFFVFVDLPVHIEFSAGSLPVLEEGTVIHFDLRLRHPSDRRRVRDVSGPHRILRRKLLYQSDGPRSGFSQYLELSPVPDGGES